MKKWLFLTILMFFVGLAMLFAAAIWQGFPNGTFNKEPTLWILYIVGSVMAIIGLMSSVGVIAISSYD